MPLHKLILAFGLIAVSNPTWADYYDRPSQRLDRQADRIEHGIDNGSLNRKEARRLKRENQELNHLYNAFISDGRLNSRERRLINARLDKASQRIARLKHNQRYRPINDYRSCYRR